MKKVIALVVSLLLFITPISSIAEENKTKYSFPDLFMEMLIPDNFYVLTKSISPDDKVLDFVGRTKEEVLSFLDSTGNLLDAFDAEFYCEFILYSQPSSLLFDMINAEDSVISKYASMVTNYYKKNGIQIYQHTTFKHHQTQFIKLYGYFENDSSSFLEYVTVMKGQEISISFMIDDSVISKKTETFADELISNIIFQDKVAQQYETIDSFNIKYISDFSLRNGVTFNSTKEEIIALEREIHDIKPYMFETNSITYIGCNVEDYSGGYLEYILNSQGRLCYIESGLGSEYGLDGIKVVKDTYTNVSIEMEKRYGTPRNQDNGLVFPLLSDKLVGLLIIPNYIQSYKQWIIECKDYYVLAEIFLLGADDSSSLQCEVSYTMYAKDEVSPLLDKNRRIF